MTNLEDKTTTTDSFVLNYSSEIEPNINFDLKDQTIYLLIENPYQEVTSIEDLNPYLFKENVILENHITLYGQDALNFDTTVKEITRNNELMSQLINDVYEDRIFET